MKKLISVFLLLAMLATLATVAAVPGAAEGIENDRTATYVAAEEKPTVDGVEDAVWKTAETHYIKNKDEKTNFRVLWDEGGLYVFITMAEADKNWCRVYVNESGTGSYLLHQVNETAGDYSTAKLGNRIFKLALDGTIAGHWLNETDKNEKRTAWIPVPGENGVEFKVKENADGSVNFELYLPVMVAGTFDEAGEMYFAISWGSGSYDQNGLVTTNGYMLTENSDPWAKSVFKMQRIINTCAHENGWNPATCVTPETCKDCGQSRGDVATTHEKEAIWTYTDTTHTHIYPCCEVKLVEDEAHEWETEYSVIKEPTCTRAGEQTYLCKTCKAPDMTRVAPVAPKGHNPGEEWELMKEPTCTKVGVEVKTCIDCMAEAESREVAALGHSGDTWVVDAEAQVGVAGKKHRVCDVCDERFDEQVIPALEAPATTEAAGGCGGSITVGALSAVLMLGGAAVVMKKKKER